MNRDEFYDWLDTILEEGDSDWFHRPELLPDHEIEGGYVCIVFSNISEGEPTQC